jgi:MTH538 TIR-like domain (DUF1863)
MSRKVFFSFHYERDAWRAGQVRNCNVIPREDQVGVIDAAEWQSIKNSGDSAIEKWIAQQLGGTSVTAVLIGAETADREWVLHEILESWNRGNGVLGIWIHNVKDSDKKTDAQGPNPFDKFALPDGRRLSSICKVYDWVNDDGRNKIANWAEDAIETRAGFDVEDDIVEVEKRVNALACPAVTAASPGALGAKVLAPRSEARLVQPSPLTSSPSRSFVPRRPWCSTDDDE